MSYVHCPTCHRAYLLDGTGCPSCAAKPADVVSALDALTRAIATATPEQLGAAWRALEARQPAPAPEVALVATPKSTLPVVLDLRTGAARRPSRLARFDRLVQLGRAVVERTVRDVARWRAAA